MAKHASRNREAKRGKQVALSEEELEQVAGGTAARSVEPDPAGTVSRIGFEVHGFINTDDPTD